jgi:hypothetical protein
MERSKSFISSVFAQRLGFIFFSLLLFCFQLLVSCNNGGAAPETKNDSTETQSEGTNDSIGAGKRVIISDDLYTLYIQNHKDSQQLGRLLGNDPGDANKKKLVLQFFRDKDGFLGLMLVASKKNNEVYKLEDAVLTSRRGKKDTTLGSEPVFLGQLQLFDEPGNKIIKDSLKAHIYDPANASKSVGWEYIWFVPEIQDVPNEAGTYTAKHIIYKLKRSSIAPAFTEKEMGKKFIEMDTYAKPSPPRGMQ